MLSPLMSVSVPPVHSVQSKEALEPALLGPVPLPPDGQPVRPFLKWAGGKRQLLPRLRRFYPETFRAYREPFLGSGAVFFDLVNSGRLAGHPVVLCDSNADLVGCYTRLRDEPDSVIRRLRRLAAGYARAPKEHYYRVRDRQFNPKRHAMAKGTGLKGDQYTVELAAALVYLNHTGFNGLFRVNASGGFNVPLGRYANPRICDEDNLRRVAAVLSESAVSIGQVPYLDSLADAEAHDFVYLDPPYAPLNSTSQFTSYTSDGFARGEQESLQKAVIGLAERGCQVLLSNSTAPQVAELYDRNPDAERVGLRAYKVPAKRAINSNAARRGPVLEYLITNLPERTS